MEAERAITYHRTALLRVVMGLFAAVGIAPNAVLPSRLPPFLRRLVLRELLPAESATRRLIFFMMKHMSPLVLLASVRAKQKKAKSAPKQAVRERAPVFWLFDRRKFFTELSTGYRVPRGPGPSIRFFDEPRRTPQKAVDASQEILAKREEESARRLCRRMRALCLALNDLPAQAKRMQRVVERRKAAPPGPKRYGPLRPGDPPGFRTTPKHEVDELLYECNLMARSARPVWV